MRSLLVHEAADWYEQGRAGLGTEFRDQLKATLDQLREGIVPGAPWPGSLGKRGVRRIALRRFPFDVVFMVSGASVFVAAIAHHARRPHYWHQRLST